MVSKGKLMTFEERKKLAKDVRQSSPLNSDRSRKSESDATWLPSIKTQHTSADNTAGQRRLSVQGTQRRLSFQTQRRSSFQFPKADASYEERRKSETYRRLRRDSTQGTAFILVPTDVVFTDSDEHVGVGRDQGSEYNDAIAPDGGYGWMVMIASFFASVIVDGVCFAFGIFFLEFLDTFQEDRSKTAWIGSVLNGMYMVTAPVSAALAKKFGCRPIAIVGAIWAGIAFVCSTFSKGVNALIITYGVLGGIGFGLMYLPSIVMVASYFDKRRAFATGIATCGSGIGAFVFAPLCKLLIEVYGWQGAQWVVAGLVLNGVVLGALYRPLTQADMYRYNEKQKQIYLEQTPDESKPINEETKEDFTNTGIVRNKDVMQVLHEADEDNISNSTHSNVQLDTKHSNDNGNNMVTVSLMSLAGSVGSLDVDQGTKSSGCREILDNVMETMDVRILKNPVFDIYGFSCILCMAGFFVPFTYLPDHCLSLGYSKAQGAFLLSILGITNTVGRIAAGWLSDRSWADCLLINNISLIVGGLCTIACPFCHTYALLCTYACVFGLCIAAFVSLRSIILVDLIGLERLTSSFGLLVLCQGISSFFGSPLAGFLYDLTDSYDLSFYVAGTVVALAGIICLPLRKLAQCQELSSTK